LCLLSFHPVKEPRRVNPCSVRPRPEGKGNRHETALAGHRRKRPGH